MISRSEYTLGVPRTKSGVMDQCLAVRRAASSDHKGAFVTWDCVVPPYPRQLKWSRYATSRIGKNLCYSVLVGQPARGGKPNCRIRRKPLRAIASIDSARRSFVSQACVLTQVRPSLHYEPPLCDNLVCAPCKVERAIDKIKTDPFFDFDRIG